MDDTMKTMGVLGGIATIIFGVAAVFWPGLTLLTLLYLFAAFVLITGLANMFEGLVAIGDKNSSSWVLKLLLGALQLGVGVYLLRHPHVTFATFILLIGFTLIFRGVFDIVVALANKMSATNKTLLMLAGVISFIVGIIVLYQPVSSGVAFVWLLGLYALITGPIAIAVALDATRK
ncbi:MAG: HdeD family acid-resistance protein [Candidatus Saccharimonadales bacterium]